MTTRWTRPTTVTAAALATVTLALGFLARPAAPRPADERTGDPELAGALAAAVEGASVHRVTAARVELGPGGATTVTTAGLGAGPADPFEVGSVAKAVTGLLVADAVDRGELTLDDRVGDHLDVTGDLADVTVRQLVTHTSGLPRLAIRPGTLGRALWSVATGGNPYQGYTGDDVVAQAQSATLGPTDPVYSNLAAALTGQVLVAATGRSYPELLTERLADPLGMPTTTAPATTTQVPEGMATGQNASGRAQSLWIMDGYAATGGVHSSAADLGTLLAALLDGSAPGPDALAPLGELDDEVRIGMFWVTSQVGAREVVWHNGMTGGFAAWIGIDREAGRGVAVLTDVATSVDEFGLELLGVRP